MSDTYHVVPQNDLEEHVINRNCHCNPTEIDGVWVHHSYDGRECFEKHLEYVDSLIPFMKMQTWKAARLHGIMKQFHEETMQYDLDDITKNRSAFTTLICLT
jgi:hypothetical protein